MRLAFIGDLHGEFPWQWPVADVLIQVGDFGYWPRYQELWERRRPPQDVFFIDGNHEHFPSLYNRQAYDPPGADGLARVWPGLVYLPRGHVQRFGALTLGFLGGGTSVDRRGRTIGWDWFDEENIGLGEIHRLITTVEQTGPLDLLVTHTPPMEVQRAFSRQFGTAFIEYWGYRKTWEDPNALRVQEAWDATGNPPLVCGHLHQSFIFHQCCLLDIAEVCYIEEGRIPWLGNVVNAGASSATPTKSSEDSATSAEPLRSRRHSRSTR